ncbi:MAG: hypothetical protein ACOX6E_07380 [Syntrophomonadaceae bacterium]|jgi:hypothetical protein
MNRFRNSQFHLIDGQCDIDQIEDWVQSFFDSTVNLINSFYYRLDLNETINALINIPFEEMVREQLKNESEQVITIAVAKIKELADMQIEYLKAYVK